MAYNNVGRIQCPMCGNKNPKHIQEIEDKTRILGRIGTYNMMYKKMYRCTDCAYEWDK